jgi:hypothetical protein
MEQNLTSEVMAGEVMISIIDDHRAVHDAMPVGMAEVVVAALAAEPETLEELETAAARYYRPILSQGFLEHFQAGVSEERWDAGAVIVDLPARLIAYEIADEIFRPAARGQALYCPDPPPSWSEVSDEEIIWVGYQLSGDWLFEPSLIGWRRKAEQRKLDRLSDPPFDARPVLFEKIAEFIVRGCLSARSAGIEDPVKEIHKRWLMTPREDLRGLTPREVLLAKRDYLEWDLEFRARQWSFTGEAPEELKRESAAYRYAGFGTHGNVVYFDLVRYLIDECWMLVSSGNSIKLEDEIARLEKLKDEWLGDGETYTFSPSWVLEQERLRAPITLAPSQAMIDPDCPLCQAAADPALGGPMFWHLDGHHMSLEEDYVFSFCRTREEWETEQKEWKEFNRSFQEEKERR